MTENFTPYFRTFGTDCSATPPGAETPVFFRAIFDDADLQPLTLGGTQADITGPRLTLRTSDAAQFPRDTLVALNSTPAVPAAPAYRVLEHHPDGTGISVLVLAPWAPRAPAAADLHDSLLS